MCVWLTPWAGAASQVVASGTDSTEYGGGSAQTMLYVGLEDGRFIGYYGPAGERAYTYCPPGGKPADSNTCPGCPQSIWKPYTSLDAVNDCTASGGCKDYKGGRNVSALCPAGQRETSAVCVSDATHAVMTGATEATCAAAAGHSWIGPTQSNPGGAAGACCTATCCDGAAL
jgi:hypothetical protein